MATVNPSAFGPKPQWVDVAGDPADGYKVFFYLAGSTSTKQDTFTDSTGLVANLNPIILNTLGEPSTQIWWPAGQSFKVVLAPPTDTDPPTSPIWTVDNLYGINDFTNSPAQNEWVLSPLTPTFINATTFTLPGNQTADFQVNRRVKSTNTAGTSYGIITSSVFTTLTTVTLWNTSGVLDSGLSQVSYGLLSAVNPSTPNLPQTEWSPVLQTPTFISATSFSVTGDRTADFQIGRRVKSTNTGGLVYSTITNSVFGAVTTVTLSNTSGVLDSGLSQVSYGILAPINPSLPNSSAARVSMGISAQARCIGLLGTNNAATPTTKLDLSANAITLKNAAGDAIVVTGTGTVTLDFGLAGPAANGRDQAGVFTASQFINAFWIYNPTSATTALIASTAVPTAAPALPAGYTYYCYATTVRWNGSSNIVPTYIRGSWAYYQAQQTALTGGVATGETPISFVNFVPSWANSFQTQSSYLNVDAAQQNGFFKLVAGVNFANSGVAPSTLVSRDIVFPNVGQSVIYIQSAATLSVTVDVLGYSVGNGDS